MSGYYPPNQNIPPQYYNVDPNAIPNSHYPNAPLQMMPDGSMHHIAPASPTFHGLPGPYVHYGEHHVQQPTYMDMYDDDPGSAGGNRPRRKSAPDQVKHRRTRTGCFTCRQRRVKCDEKHPACDRCRKGNRECVYPDPNTVAKPNREGGLSSQKSGTKSSTPEDAEGEDEDSPSHTAMYDDEDEDVDTDSRRSIKREPGARDPSDTPSLTMDRSPSPLGDSSRPLSRKPSNHMARAPLSPGPSTSGLPSDVRFYLDYFKNHMSYHHYSLKTDHGNFFKNDFLSLAIKHEPLRYAVVGYAAYFHTLTNPDGRISDFLKYYNESVSRLRASITKSKKQGLSTFLTILQLASIEEMLGDWVNLMGHQKAAYELLTRLYTPETIIQSALLRKVLLWYTRFDMFIGFQSGGDAILGREWYVTVYDYYKEEARKDPDNLPLKYEERFAFTRLVAKEQSNLFSRKAKGVLTDAEFMEELPRLAEIVSTMDKNIDPVLMDPDEMVTTLVGEPEPEDIVNPYEPKAIWGGSRWASNFLLIDQYAIIFMFHVQVSMAMRTPPDPALTEKALRTAQIFEAVCEYPKGPPGAILEAQACLAIATFFLPKDPKTTMWLRRSFAKIENAGYIYSNVLRKRMLETWGVEYSDWWLPNGEGCRPIIRSIKDFIQERTTAPKDQTAEDLREMKGLFSTLTISDSPPDDNTGGTPPESALASQGVPSNLDETLVYTSGSPDYENWIASQGAYGAQGYEDKITDPNQFLGQ